MMKKEKGRESSRDSSEDKDRKKKKEKSYDMSSSNTSEETEHKKKKKTKNNKNKNKNKSSERDKETSSRRGERESRRDERDRETSPRRSERDTRRDGIDRETNSRRSERESSRDRRDRETSSRRSEREPRRDGRGRETSPRRSERDTRRDGRDRETNSRRSESESRRDRRDRETISRRSERRDGRDREDKDRYRGEERERFRDDRDRTRDRGGENRDRREYDRSGRRRDRERSRSRRSSFSRRERSRSGNKKRDTKSRHTSETEPTQPPEPLKPAQQPIWGQGIKKTPEPKLPPTKSSPMVGKMPCFRLSIPSSSFDTTENIPLPGDPMGVDMDIAYIPAPPMPDICHHWCKCFKLRRKFSCSEDSMDFRMLMSGVGISLLLFPDPNPLIPHIKTSTTDPDKLDGETEKLYQSWRSRMGAGDVLMDMSSIGNQLHTGRQEVSDQKEQHIQALFREQINKQWMQQPAALFSNLHPGPRIAYTPFGYILENILKADPNKTTTLLTAFNVFNRKEPDLENWRKQINKTRQEKDLVMVVGEYSCVIEVEVKSGGNVKYVDQAVKQIEQFYNYMRNSHGPFVNSFHFAPIVAKSKDVVSQTICNDCQLDIDATATDFESWFHNRFDSLSNNITATPEECKSLIKRLLLVSSLVLTSLPAPSKDSLDLNLILLRKSQWNFLSARPSFAVIHGKPSTGKSTALELGLAFILPNAKIDRYLASFDDNQNFQNTWRQKFFKKSGSVITLFAQEEEEEEEQEESGKNSILQKVMSDIEDKKTKGITKKPIICIDNVPKKDLLNPVLLKQLVWLKENSQYLWIVMDMVSKEDKLSEEDQQEMMREEELAPTFLVFD